MGNSVGHQFDFCNCKQRKRKRQLQNQEKKKKQQAQIDPNNIKDLQFKQSGGNCDEIQGKVKFEGYVDELLTKSPALVRHNESFAMRFNQDYYFRGPQIQYYRQNYNVKPRRVEPKAFNWNKDRIIGSGTFGTVSLGFNRDTGQIMAVKQSLIANNQDIDKIKTLEQEVWLLSQLRNDNIVRYLGAVRTTSTLNIFLQYCSGGSISSLLRQFGKFNEKLVQKYTWDILKGLEYLHALGVIHRDIKGANVLLSKNGVCKIADFGNAKVIYKSAQGSMPQTMQGTPNWMAPQVIKRGEYGRFADIWSVGCLVIQMITAKPPWYVKNAQHNPYAVLYKIAQAKQPPPFPEDTSDNLKDFLRKCLQVNPFQRANVYELLRHSFFSELKSKSFKARKISNKDVFAKGGNKIKNIAIDRLPSSSQQKPSHFTFPPQPYENQDMLSQLQNKMRIPNLTRDPSIIDSSPLDIDSIQGSSSSSRCYQQEQKCQQEQNVELQQQNDQQGKSPQQNSRKAQSQSQDFSISLQTSFQFKINAGNTTLESEKKSLQQVQQSISNPNQCDGVESSNNIKNSKYGRNQKQRCYKQYNQDDVIHEVPEMEQQQSENFKINDDQNPQVQERLLNKSSCSQKRRNKLTVILEEIHQDKKITLSKARALIRRSSGEFNKSMSQILQKHSMDNNSLNDDDIQQQYKSNKIQYNYSNQEYFNFDQSHSSNFDRSGDAVLQMEEDQQLNK